MQIQTKKDYQNVLLEMLQPLRNRYSSGGARLKLLGAGGLYTQDVVELEAFARPLWGLVPFWAGGGQDNEFEALYYNGICSGTNPTHPEYWGDCKDNDQRFVEMAPIAFGLLLTPQILWDPLNKTEKKHLMDWLGQINKYKLPKCNWHFFRILVNLALEKHGHSYSKELLDSDLEFIEACYLGNGWYVDGTSEQKDYYSAFAMQFYGLLYAVCFKSIDKDRSKRLKGYAVEFSKDFIYWFDEGGAGLPYGRSLTYRFAQTAFWSAVVFADVNAFDLGIVKGIIERNLEYWFEKQIYQGDKTLSIGYGYPNLNMAETYNAPGSPYWSTKTFLLLALPDNHFYWRVKKKPLPKLDLVHPIVMADMLIHRRTKDVTAYVPGVYSKNPLGHFMEKYGKFAYSTAFSFSVAHSSELLGEAAPDSMLAFVPVKEDRVYVRKRSDYYNVDTDEIISEWSPMQGVEVRTRIKPTAHGHVRRHEIISEKHCMVYDCGFAVNQFEVGFQVQKGQGFAEASNERHGCRISLVNGIAMPYIVDANPNTNLLYKKTIIPALCSELLPGKMVIETHIETWINDI